MFYKTGKHARLKSSSVPHAVDNPTVIRTLHPQLSREQAPRNLVQGFKMSALKTTKLMFVMLLAMLTLSWAMGKTLGQPVDKDHLMSELDLVDDDGSIETALINYLFAKQVVNRLRSQMDVSDLQRKRSYWKQCAFNAVSCFGKK